MRPPQTQSRFKTTHVLQISSIYYRQLPDAFLAKTLRSSGALDIMFALVSKASNNCYNENIYIPSFLFEHFSLVSKPADGLFSSSALLVQSSVVTYLNIICWNKSSLALAVFSF